MYRMNNYGCTTRDRSALPGNRATEKARCDYSITQTVQEEPIGEFDFKLAMVYSPEQAWQNLYTVEEGLCAGTIFKELNKPFYGPRCNGGSCNV